MFEKGDFYSWTDLTRYEDIKPHQVRKMCKDGVLTRHARGCYKVLKPFRIREYGNLQFIELVNETDNH